MHINFVFCDWFFLGKTTQSIRCLQLYTRDAMTRGFAMFFTRNMSIRSASTLYRLYRFAVRERLILRVSVCLCVCA